MNKVGEDLVEAFEEMVFILRGEIKAVESYRIKDLYPQFNKQTGIMEFFVDQASHEKYKARSEAAQRAWAKRKSAQPNS